MGKSYDGKKRWNETVRQTTAALAASHRRSSGNAGHKAAAKHGKRLSGRAVKLSAAMKFVDEETRALVRNARLDALEADNYGVDVEADADAAADELYVDDDGAEVDAKKMPKGRRRAATSRANKFKVKSLAQLVFEELGTNIGDVVDPAANAEPNYLTVAAAPSAFPPRRFCVVCGFFASYACARCGSRFCRVQCGEQHKESGCLKFGL